MNDNLKDVVDKQREMFDVYQTDYDALWPDVEKGINKRKRTAELMWVWRSAAAVVFGFGLAYVLNFVNQPAINSDELAYQISPEWAETEEFYKVKISEKMDAITSRAELDPVIMEDIALLDQAYKELKTDLADGADNEEVINAMISNYQIKLEILERILMEIKRQGREWEMKRILSYSLLIVVTFLLSLTVEAKDTKLTKSINRKWRVTENVNIDIDKQVWTSNSQYLE